MSNTKILLVEDDVNLGAILHESLIYKGNYDVQLCRDGEEALRAFKSRNFDLCILDVMMPKKDGFTLARDIRRINETIPIIFATAKGMLEDKTEGFSLGADDYISKPFSIDELLLRITAVLKRTIGKDGKEAEQKTFKIGHYDFNSETQTLNIDNRLLKMTTKESDLLRLLCLHKNEVLTREEALLKIWHDDSYFNGRSMDVFLTKIRKYLKEDPRVEILNVHGKGYKLVVME